MSDQQRTEEGERATTGGESDSVGGIDAPGGGPKRVVSETSVDDILSKLDDAADGDAEPDRGRTSPTIAKPAAPDPASADADPGGTGRVDGESDVDAATVADHDEPDVDAATGVDRDDGPLAAAVAGASADDLAATTSAPVDADPDPEPTPSIDEIDLSMDDLEATVGDAASSAGRTEATVAGRSAGAGERAPEDGPLAGMIDRSTTATAGDGVATGAEPKPDAGADEPGPDAGADERGAVEAADGDGRTDGDGEEDAADEDERSGWFRALFPW